MFSETLLKQAETLLATARMRGLRIVTAESCTGGLIAGLLTEIAGSSDVFERGFVTYSNQAKEDLLGVPGEALKAHGAVSSQVARAMAEGALKRSLAQCAVAVTGIAGPGGSTAQKPVGLVHVAVTRLGQETKAREFRFGAVSRDKIRLNTVAEALALLTTLF